MANEAIVRAGERLAEGWIRYVNLFGIPPLGTAKQMAALLELSKPGQWIKNTKKVKTQEKRETK